MVQFYWIPPQKNKKSWDSHKIQDPNSTTVFRSELFGDPDWGGGAQYTQEQKYQLKKLTAQAGLQKNPTQR